MKTLIGKTVLVKFEVIEQNKTDPKLYWLRTQDGIIRRQIWLYEETILELLNSQQEVDGGRENDNDE